MAEPALLYIDEAHTFRDSAAEFMRQEHDSLEKAVSRWDQTALGRIKFSDSDTKRQYISNTLRKTGDGLAYALHKANIELFTSRVKFDIFAGRAPMPNPCLALWGEHGGLREETEPALQRLFPTYESCEIAGAAHPLSLTCKDEIEPIRSFLKVHSGQV